MNLVQDPWLPFKMQDGSQQVLPMREICNPEVLDFALPRADFQGAAYQFAIGLLQTVFAPEDKEDWLDFYKQAPKSRKLQQAFDKAVHAFNADGEGALFMQDFDTLTSVDSVSVSGLLIEAPGANGIKNNTDHFIKRGTGWQMSLEMATLALFTLQINAPSGGSGHRVGLRGGGPLTTLVLPQSTKTSLWQKLWLNIIDTEAWRYEKPDLHSENVFPWLSATKTSERNGSEVYSTDVHPLYMYWAMPRRIRLEVETKEVFCQILGNKSTKSVSSYKTQNYGCNYSGTWRHPFTPYRWDPKKPEQDHNSVKAQPGGISYKIWDSLTFTSDNSGQETAKVVNNFKQLVDYYEQDQNEIPRLWAFGYDMDNMKARGWYSVSMPLFSLPTESQEDLLNQVKELQKLAVETLKQCRTQIKTAWFERPADAKGDISFIDLAFWQRTETCFFNSIQQLINNMSNDEPFLTSQQAKKWLDTLRNTALDLFDEYALAELGSVRSMAKRIKSRKKLSLWLISNKQIKNFIIENKIETTKDKTTKEVV